MEEEASLDVALVVAADSADDRMLEEALIVENATTATRKVICRADCLKKRYDQNHSTEQAAVAFAAIDTRKTYLCDPFKVPMAHMYTDMDRIGLERSIADKQKRLKAVQWHLEYARLIRDLNEEIQRQRIASWN